MKYFKKTIMLMLVAVSIVTLTSCGNDDDDQNNVETPPVVGHEYVDLKLPSGTLWATMNIGAISPEDRGDYFSWGEVTGYNSGKRQFDWNTYKWIKEGESTNDYITKYTYDDKKMSAIWYKDGVFVGDNKLRLDPEDDAATDNWGSDWCTPTSAQLRELIDPNYTITEKLVMNGVYGLKVTSKENGNFIFLPFASKYRANGLDDDREGEYWSCELYDFENDLIDNNTQACALWIRRGSDKMAVIKRFRNYGLSVRAVRNQN